MPNEASQQVDLRIEGELSIYRADELKRALIKPLQSNVRLVVNLAAVTELDTCGLQLLMLVKRTAAKLGASCNWWPIARRCWKSLSYSMWPRSLVITS